MKNAYEIRGDVTAIFIESAKHGRQETLIDTEDLGKVKDATSWILRRELKMDSFYVVGYYGPDTKRVYLHRLVLGVTGPAVLIDHISHDTLDNRKSQLRIVTYAENNQNSRGRKDNTSGYRGINLSPCGTKWQARIQSGGVRVHLGYFKELSDAVNARKNAERKYFKYTQEIKEGGD